MRNEEEVLQSGPSVAGPPAVPVDALNWYTPVRFDPALLRKLIEQHEKLDERVASLPNLFGRDRAEALKTAQVCAGQLHELRRQEALWIYPVMARHFAGDAGAHRQVLNLRFVMNGLARRVLRAIDDLARAMRLASDVAAAAAAVVRALTEYRQRNEAELYTLYSLMDPRQPRSAAARVHSR